MIYLLLFLFFELYQASDNLYKIRLFTQTSGSNILIFKCIIDGEAYPMEIDLNANKSEIISNEVMEKKTNFTIETIQNRSITISTKILTKIPTDKNRKFCFIKKHRPSLLHYSLSL